LIGLSIKTLPKRSNGDLFLHDPVPKLRGSGGLTPRWGRYGGETPVVGVGRDLGPAVGLRHEARERRT
jgi:hypothetical protein